MANWEKLQGVLHEQARTYSHLTVIKPAENRRKPGLTLNLKKFMCLLQLNWVKT